jgi:lipid-binding SYLF domain-containing protein
MQNTGRISYWGLLGLGVVLVSLISGGWAADQNDRGEVTKRLSAAAKVLDEIMSNPDKAIPEGVIKRATCVAVFPSTLQVAVLVGAKHGKGFTTCRTAQGWSAPAPISISGGSWGAQLGGEEVDLVMVITDDKGMQQLLSGKFNLGTETSITAGPTGNHDLKVNADVLSYSRSRGIFAGTNFGGSSISQDEDDTRALYGSSPSLFDILSGKVQSAGPGESFTATVTKYAGQTREKD